MLKRHPSRRILVIGVLALLGHQARADSVTDLADTMLKGKPARTRLIAAIALARTGDARALRPFIGALGDEDKTVRGVAATALGNLGDARAISALERAQADVDPFVRDKASEALAKLRAQTARPREAVPKETPRIAVQKKTYVTVKSTFNKAPSGGKVLAGKLKEFIEHELGASEAVSMDMAARGSAGAFMIDGAITEISKKTSTLFVEVTCSVKLMVGTYPEGRVVTMVTGGATVQTPKRAWRATMEKDAQLDALASAVKGANQSLVGFLAKQR